MPNIPLAANAAAAPDPRYPQPPDAAEPDPRYPQPLDAAKGAAPDPRYPQPPAAAEAAAPPDAEFMGGEAIRRLLAIDPAQRPAFPIDANLFDRRLHAYRLAQAAVVDPARLASDEAGSLAYAALEIAELLLLATPAARPQQVWTKLEIVEALTVDGLRTGQDPAPRLLMALASFKHDLMRFDLGDGGRVYPKSV